MEKILKKILRKVGLEINFIRDNEKNSEEKEWIKRNPLPFQILNENNCSIFFGYHDKTPVNSEGTKLLANRVQNSGSDPQDFNEIMEVGYFRKDKDNRFNSKFIKVGETITWSLQQGCMLQWNPAKPDREIIFNKLINNKYGSVIYNLDADQIIKEFDFPLYSLDPAGRYGSSLSFGRLGRLRPGYGYKNYPDTTENEACPQNDGLFLIDLKNNTSELIITLSQLAEYTDKTVHHYVNHVIFSPSGKEITFFHIYPDSSGKRLVRFYLYLIKDKQLILLEAANRLSHYCWLNSNEILTTEGLGNKVEYFLYDIQKKVKTKIDLPEIGDLHPMVHPVYKDIIVADSKPDIHRNQDLYLFNINSGNNRHIGSFYSPVEFVKEKRCDLHPRWDRTGDYIFVDTPYHGRRSIAVIDVSALNGKLPL